MDPISILGIAAAVVQFVDFGTKLLSNTTEAFRYTTGKEGTSTTLASMAEKVNVLCVDVESKSRDLMEAALPGSCEEVFLGLCSECKTVAKELNDAISKLHANSKLQVDSTPGRRKCGFARGKRKVFSTISLIFRTVLSQSKLTELEERMSNIRQQVSMAALICLW